MGVDFIVVLVIFALGGTYIQFHRTRCSGQPNAIHSAQDYDNEDDRVYAETRERMPAIILDTYQCSDRTTMDGAEVCSMCTDNFQFGENIVRLQCCHIFHNTPECDLIHTWLNRSQTCPLCQTPA